jgi:hypothetical protein
LRGSGYLQLVRHICHLSRTSCSGKTTGHKAVTQE